MSVAKVYRLAGLRTSRILAEQLGWPGWFAAVKSAIMGV
jgi:hypothetical protein